MSATPYDIIAGPATVWVAPVATAFPAVNAVPGGGWTAMGWTDGGLKVKHGQKIDLLRVDQATGPVKAIRSEETLELMTSLAELTLENFALLLNLTAPTTSNVKGSLTTALTGANNDVVWTAVTGGVAGNTVRIRYVDPGAPSAALSVSVASNDITVNLATNGSSVITSTSAQVIAAVAASGPANALITGANAGADTGAGVVTSMAFTNLAGGADARKIGIRQGLDVATFALLVRGPSPYGNFNMQYEVPIVVQVDEPEPDFVRDGKAVLAVNWTALEDPAASTASERFGRLIAQTA